MIYAIIFVVLALLASLDLVKESNFIKSVCFFFLIAFFIILSGIRWQVGPDWESYLSFYKDIDLYTGGVLISSNFMEPGYTKMNVWVNELGFNYTGFLFAIAILTIGIKARVIYDHKAILMISLFLYYCYYLADIASVRQFTALSITLLSSLFIVKRKPIIFCLLVFLACTIHISCILFLFAYWLYYRPYSPRLLYLTLLITFTLGIVNIADFAVNTVVSLIGGSSNIALKLLLYQEQGLESSVNPYVGFILGVLKRVIMLPLFISGVKIIDDKYKDRYIGYLNLLVFGNAVYFLFALSIPVIQRLSVPFLIFEIFLWGFLLISVKEVKMRFFLYFLVVAFGAFRLYAFIAPYKDHYFPFKIFLEFN